MFNLQSALSFIERLTGLRVVDEISIVESDLIREEMLRSFHLHPKRTDAQQTSGEKEVPRTFPETLSVADIFGEYDPDKRQITIYTKMIQFAVETMGDKDIDFDSLKNVILFHEVTHAVTHIGKDEENRIWGNFKSAPSDDKELFAQIYPYYLFKNVDTLFTARKPEEEKTKKALGYVFSKFFYVFSQLCKHQDVRYNLWLRLKGLSLDEINQALRNARQNKIPFQDFFVEISYDVLRH